MPDMERLTTLRIALNDAEAMKDQLYPVRSLTVEKQIQYDLAVAFWARVKNKYDDALRQELPK
jgi:hypothetical protein